MEFFRRDLWRRLNTSTGEELRSAIQQGERWASFRGYERDVAEAIDQEKRRLGSSNR